MFDVAENPLAIFGHEIRFSPTHFFEKRSCWAGLGPHNNTLDIFTGRRVILQQLLTHGPARSTCVTSLHAVDARTTVLRHLRIAPCKLTVEF
jgi:hypothetical protein